MSKHINEQHETKLKVVAKAEDMLCHTIDIADNANVFPKRHRLTFTNRIINKALEIYTCICMAEELYPTNRNIYNKRLEYQSVAMASCRTLNCLIGVAQRKFNLTIRQAEYWSKMVTDVRNMTVAWTVKDAQRFKNLK